jgi:hypothetical protein
LIAYISGFGDVVGGGGVVFVDGVEEFLLGVW